MGATRLVRGLNILSLIVALMVLAGVAFFLGMGTLFFDDPHADYGTFVHQVTLPVVPVIAVTVLGQVGSRLLARRAPYPAAFIAGLPVLLIVAGAIYLAS